MKRYLVFTCFLSIRQIVLKFVPEYEKIIGTKNLIELTGLKKSTFYKNLKMDTKEKR